MLRLPSKNESARVLRAFIEDPTIDLEIRTTVKEAIVSGAFQVSEPEYRTVTERILAEGERRGIEQGIEQGVERGIRQGVERGIRQGVEQSRRALIEQVRAALGEEAAASLESISDFAELSAQAIAMSARGR